MIVSIDPGLHLAGLAIWSPAGGLHSAQLVRASAPGPALGVLVDLMLSALRTTVNNALEYGLTVDEIAIEFPQIYDRTQSNVDPKDLIDLALMAGALSGVFGSNSKRTFYRPREWKGQLPKDISEKRSLSKLTDEEATKIQLPRAAALSHNVYDAIGIGLKHVARRRSTWRTE